MRRSAEVVHVLRLLGPLALGSSLAGLAAILLRAKTLSPSVAAGRKKQLLASTALKSRRRGRHPPILPPCPHLPAPPINPRLTSEKKNGLLRSLGTRSRRLRPPPTAFLPAKSVHFHFGPRTACAPRKKLAKAASKIAIILPARKKKNAPPRTGSISADRIGRESRIETIGAAMLHWVKIPLARPTQSYW